LVKYLSSKLKALTSILNTTLKKKNYCRLWWLTPIILATQEAEIRRITV
jgi:hypothetical protein